jgi:hypothetical protein
LSPSLTRLSWPNTTSRSRIGTSADRITADATIEGEVWMTVQIDTVGSVEFTFPGGKSPESIVNGNVQALSFSYACNFTNNPMCLVIALKYSSIKRIESRKDR